MLVEATLIFDASRAALVALSVAVALGVARFVGGWLMRSARDDFRESVCAVVREEVQSQIGALRADHAALKTSVDDGFTTAMSEREALGERLDAAVSELTHNGGHSLKDTVTKHTRWLQQIASAIGIVLDDPQPPTEKS